MNYFASNLKFLRNSKSWSQQVLAEKIGVARSTITDYERQKSEPSLATLQLIAKAFGTSIDDLLQKNLKEEAYTIIKNKHMKVLAISVDKNNDENIELVPNKAQAGYTAGYGDIEFIAELPKIHLPQLNAGTYRAFEIEGDSMLPIPSGTIILGSYVENNDKLKQDLPYIVVTDKEGIVFKRVKENSKRLQLISDNPAYPPYFVEKETVLELWKFEAAISFDYQQPTSLTRLEDKLEAVHQLLKTKA